MRKQLFKKKTENILDTKISDEIKQLEENENWIAQITTKKYLISRNKKEKTLKARFIRSKLH